MSIAEVPPALKPLFSTADHNVALYQRRTPFSYTKPTPGGPKPHPKPLECPKVIPKSFWSSLELDDDSDDDPKPIPDEMPQTVHLQYNSPMGLYSKEAAVEQFEQQIGAAPNADLPAPDKHFDPSKSATLKYLNETGGGGDDALGDAFFEKVARAEAPRARDTVEPDWARMAREKSERARSKTPAEQRYRPASSPAPLSHPVHLETAREHAEKNKIFTHNIHEPYTRPYYEAAFNQNRMRRSQSAGREYHNRGYELGGLDFTQGIHIDHGTDYQYYAEPPRKPQPAKQPPGYELGGTDFYRGHTPNDGHYRGHGPDPPRLRPKYSADPHDPCNVVVAPNIEAVDANLLVGDTVSNQKIKHEVRHIDQSTFGTSFAPPQGFRRDHTTVRRAPPPPQPVTFSVSANKHLARSQSVPRSSAPPDQRDVFYSGAQYEADKEVSIRTLLNDEALRVNKRETSPYWADRSEQKHAAWSGRVDPRLQRYETYITEPNWRRNVDQRRQAWERRAFETEQKLSRPYSERVAPGMPPSWLAEAQHKQQQWQRQADNMNNSYNQASHDIPKNQPMNGSQNYQYTSTTTTTTSNVPQSQHVPENLVNTGYNTNQVNYVQSHADKYVNGPHYQPPIINQQQQQHQHEKMEFSEKFQRDLHSPLSRSIPIRQAGTFSEVCRSRQSDRSEIASDVKSEISIHEDHHHHHHQQQTDPIPLPAPTGNYEASNYNKTYSTHSTTTTTQQPVAQPASNNYSTSFHSERTFNNSSSHQPSQAIAIPSGGNQNYSYHTESHSTTGPIIMHSPGGQSFKSTEFSSSRYNKQEKTTTTTTTNGGAQPLNRHASYNYTSSTNETPKPAGYHHESFTSHTEKTSNNTQPQPAAYQYENYLSSRKEESRREETSRPVSQLSQYSESRNYKRNYSEKTETTTVPAATTNVTHSYKDLSNAQSVDDVFNKRTEMNEKLPVGSISNTHNNTEGGYRDASGHDVHYKRETQTSADPGRETSLLKEEEKRVVETPLEPGVISRHVTTKYYKKKTVTDTTTTTAPA
ncbi:unnamed protein product [Caenorhabditis bovis]|uniref:Zasp-like motif domain-containing protein n=1 Tax=Caenorhabditis bovis TaxID=2654633 RepID=A0A8S1F9J7_9PELO|nr:unnamed protein product [Caenorhabditis bovis]